jgi:hypothetical protein
MTTKSFQIEVVKKLVKRNKAPRSSEDSLECAVLSASLELEGRTVDETVKEVDEFLGDKSRDGLKLREEYSNKIIQILIENNACPINEEVTNHFDEIILRAYYCEWDLEVVAHKLIIAIRKSKKQYPNNPILTTFDELDES